MTPAAAAPARGLVTPLAQPIGEWRDALTRALGDERALWFINRGFGVVAAVLLTLSVVLGVLATARAGSRIWPRFATQALHRNVSLLSLAVLTVHIGAAVIDDYVDISWYDAVVPVNGGYRPMWLGFGALALDIVVVTVVSSLIRRRLGRRQWRALHVMSYAAWGFAVAHGLGIGTDRRDAWAASLVVACIGAVAASAVVRLATQRHERRLAT